MGARPNRRRSNLARLWRESTPAQRLYFAALTLTFPTGVVLFIAGDQTAGVILICIYAASGIFVLPALSARQDAARRRQNRRAPRM